MAVAKHRKQDEAWLMASQFKHDRSVPQKSEDEEEDDPVIKMIKKTGCLEKHYAIQECMFEREDWRKCQDEVKTFKECMAEYQKNIKKSQ